MSYEAKGRCHFSPLLQYTIPIPFSKLQSINRYGFYILNAYLPSEATRLKTSITFVARTMGTRAPSIVLKTHKFLKACDTSFLAGIHIMQRELYVTVKKNFSICHQFQLLQLRFFKKTLIDIIILLL